MEKDNAKMLAIAAAVAVTAAASKIIFDLYKKNRTPKLKLYYFDLPGKGEAIRLACKYAGIPLEDVRITREDFDKLKANGTLALGQVPALEVDGKDVIVQSASIMRYIGKISGLYPECPLKAALIDTIIDEEVDLTMGLSVSRYRGRFGFGVLDLDSQKETVEVIRKSLNDAVIPRHLAFLEAFLLRSKTGWIADTKKPSIADFVLVPRLEWLASGANDGISKDILKPFPKICALIARFRSVTDMHG